MKCSTNMPLIYQWPLFLALHSMSRIDAPVGIVLILIHFLGLLLVSKGLRISPNILGIPAGFNMLIMLLLMNFVFTDFLVIGLQQLQAELEAMKALQDEQMEFEP